jgi:hypothetical protein
MQSIGFSRMLSLPSGESFASNDVNDRSLPLPTEYPDPHQKIGIDVKNLGEFHRHP